MSKSILEKRIEEKAEKRVKQEYKDLIKYLNESKIAKYIKVTIGEEKINLSNFGSNFGLLNGDMSSQANRTNIFEVIEQLEKDYIQQETDTLLENLKSIHYLFDRNEQF